MIKQERSADVLPWRKYVEAHTFYQIASDVKDLDVLVLSCGSGHYTRQIKLRGAAKVTGVDPSQELIKQASQKEQRSTLGIDYHHYDIQTLNLGEKYDLVCAFYVLSTAKMSEELVKLGKVIAHHLKPGGRFVAINSNPSCKCGVNDMAPYGFTRENKSYAEGAEIIYRFQSPNGDSAEFTKYHLARSTHEIALDRAGFHNIQWHPLKVSPEGIRRHGKSYWREMLKYQPFVGLSCLKP